jgi:hypothetical protein
VTISIFLAKLIGPFFLALGLGLAFNRAAVRSILDELSHNPTLVFLGGVMTMPAGLAIVLTHNVWVADWPLLITVLGWLTVFSGAVRIVSPQSAIQFGRKIYERPNGALFSAAIWLVLGAILCFFGYVK